MKPTIVYFGTPQFSAHILEELIKSNKFIIQAVITRADKPVGRKQQVQESFVANVANKHKIPVLKPKKLDEEFISTNHQLLSTDLFVVASYGKIIPQAVLDIPKKASINVHGSILPKLRGASPIQTAILEGEKETGATIMLMDAEMDHGDILNTIKISISEQDTFETLSTKMSEVAAPLLIETLEGFLKGNIKPQKQDHEKATFCKLLKKEDAYFPIENPPSNLNQMIRAFYPWPGVWTKWRSSKGVSKIVKFYPGGKIQMEGKKVMPLPEFLNGYPDFPLQEL
jgi:methionyl-tRNA formyltransferase